MPLDVPEQGWHLSEDIFGRREVEELSLCGVKVARCPLDKRPIAKYPEPLARVWRLSPSRLPRRLKKQGKQLIGGDGVAVVSSRTHIVKDGRELTGASRLAELEGADTVSLKVRVFRPKHWRKDEDGNKIATFRARRIVITD